MGQFAHSVMQRAASAADPLRFIDAARKRNHDYTLHDQASAAAKPGVCVQYALPLAGWQRTCVYRQAACCRITRYCSKEQSIDAMDNGNCIAGSLQ